MLLNYERRTLNNEYRLKFEIRRSTLDIHY